MSLEPEQGLSEEIVYDGKLFKVLREMVRLPNGHERVREIVQHPGAVVMVMVDGDGKLLLVRQYRRAAQRVLLELPAGTREPGEDPEACALREAVEETGYEASKIDRLGGFYSAPGFCTEYLHCYLLTDLAERSGEADDDENIELVRLSRGEAIAAIQDGEITDAKSISGVLMWATRSPER